MADGPAADDAVIWHDVECAEYGADLPLWRELAEDRASGVLELGCGTGRVMLDLAERGHELAGLDSDPALVAALVARARERGLRLRTSVGDARSFALGVRFALVIAPMQLVQLLGGAQARRAMLAAVRRHLSSGGLFAAALADPFDGVSEDEALPPLPDVRERDGWVYSSTPIAVRRERGATTIDRLREAVSPTGELTESIATVRLDRFAREELETAAAELGYRPLPARAVASTEAHVGSAVAMLETV